MRLVLASTSPARASLLRAAGLPFDIVAPGVDEAPLRAWAEAADWTPAAAALMLAEHKALAVSARQPAAIVIGADQILDAGGDWFAKPTTLRTAAAHLRALRSRRHTLHTAVCAARNGAVVWSVVAAPTLTMRAVSDAAVDAYVSAEGEAILGCVGAYRIEGLGITLFDAVEGEFAAILGLPMLPLLAFLRAAGALAT